MKRGNVSWILRTGAVFGISIALFAHIGGQVVNNDSIFELDGNAVDGVPAGRDWGSINPNTPPPKGQNGFQGHAFIADGTSGATIFTTGGSKDDLDITSWRHTNGAVPDKDDIVNAYAAAYSVCDQQSPAQCDLVLYFGLDRFAQNGDANAGFWFNQAGGVVDTNNTGRFTGAHMDHDILVLSTFTGGGAVSGIEVLEWNPTYCKSQAGASDPSCNITSNKTLRRLFPTGAVQAQCGAGSSPDACGIANSSAITVNWTYQAKGGGNPAGSVPIAGFFEGGINLTHLLASAGVGTTPCFTSFLAETRSSSSEDATLKDFAAGGFPVCGLQVTKACPTCSISQNGTMFRFPINGTVTNTGFGPVYNVVVTDDAGTPNATSDDLTFNIGTVQAGATINWGGGPNDYFESATQNPASNTAKAVGSTDVGNTQKLPVVDSGLIQCGVCAPNPLISVTKTCTAGPFQASAGSPVVIKVDYSGSVSNTGNVKLTSVSVSEDNDANGSIDVTALTLTKSPNVTCTSCELLPGETATFSGSYFPSVLNVIANGRADFADTVRAQGTSALPPTSTANATPATAHCPLCPLGTCALQ